MRVGFIGGGNMASALIGGMIRAGFPAADIAVLEPKTARREELAAEFGLVTHANAGAWVGDVSLLVLAVKPQQMQDAVAGLAGLARSTPLLSVAAGVRARDIARWVGHDQVIRAMPNTPALIGAGITGVAALAGVPDHAKEVAHRVLEAAGEVLWFDDEDQLDAVTAVSGSGPAYVFLFIEALEAAAIARGLPPEQARRLAISTFTGAAQLAAQSPDSPAVLRDRVTSKGGTTAAALATLEAGGIRALIDSAVTAAERRATELGDEFGAA
ncbi:MAG: pyrroline-5-carboxylate reductase [Burkholderiaceae bacterium]